MENQPAEVPKPEPTNASGDTPVPTDGGQKSGYYATIEPESMPEPSDT